MDEEAEQVQKEAPSRVEHVNVQPVIDPARSKIGEHPIPAQAFLSENREKVKKEVLADWKQEILAELAKWMGLERSHGHADLAALAIKEVNRSPFTDWLVEEPKKIL